MELVQIYGGHSQDCQALLAGSAKSVKTRIASPRLSLSTCTTAFGCDHHVTYISWSGISAQCLGHDLFVVANRVPRRRIDICGVEQRDARIERRVDCRDRLLTWGKSVCHREREGHTPKPNRRNGEVANAHLRKSHPVRLLDHPTTTR